MDGAPVKVAVLGVGLIGGSIGLAARRRLGAEVVGWGHRSATVERAVELGALDRAAASAAEACAGADLVFCAAPVAALPRLVAEALAAVGPDTAVTDAGSTKRELVAGFGGDERFIGGHPLAGAETAGVENAREDLFDGARWYLTPTERTSGLLYDRLQRTIAGLGARPQAIDATAHDRMMATVSHLPHVLANALAAEAAGGVGAGGPGAGRTGAGAAGGSAAGVTGEGAGGRPAAGDAAPERLPEVGPSFRDATRVAGSNPAVWADIFSTNREAVADAVEAVARRLEGAAALIRSGEREEILAWHAAAGEDRRRLLDADLPGGPLQELRISLPNRPGTIAELALALGEAGVNIEDMALHPAAGNHSGAVSLWVAGAEQADRAAARVRELGHTVAVQGAGD
jgi:prephenate dehydrogenase